MNVWYIEINGSYQKMLSPSSYSGECEDLDSNSYRSIVTGDLIDTVISTRWSKLKFSYKCLSEEEFFSISEQIKKNPIKAKCLHPIYEGGYIVAEFRVSRLNWEILETGDYTLSFNLVQKKRVSGQ
jgi:hypothetical protein